MTMAKKKKTTISKAEAFYIEAHFGQKSPEEMAAELELPVVLVAEYLDGLSEAGVRPKKQKDPLDKAGYDVHEGEGGTKTVSLTQRGSELIDKSLANPPPRKVNVGRLKGGVHIINPKLPTN